MSTLKTDTITTVDGTGNITFSRPVTGNGGLGKILQCLQSVKTDTASNTTTSFATITDLSVNITPSATNSKILVSWDFNGWGTNDGSSIQIVRDSTSIVIGDADGSRTRATANIASPNSNVIQNVAGQYLDSPSTTSQITYAIQCRCNSGAANYINRSSADADNTNGTRLASSITVMEVGA